MLIIPHALHCVDGCCFVFYLSWQSGILFLVSVFPPPRPPPPLPTLTPIHIFFSFQIWILCQNSLTRELKIRVVGFALKKLFTHFEMLIVSHCPTLCKWSLFCILSLLTVCYTVLVPVLDNHVSDEQLMSIRNIKEWQDINYMCFEAYQAI